MNLPTGTVTFLFTDIEGSTKLWEQHPDAMRDALARHDVLMHQAIANNDGVVFKTMGDAFCAAFATAPEALLAALTAQTALQTEPWPEPLSLNVRMALHTGAADERAGDYFGPPLNRVARLLATGHGRQVLVSDVAYDLCRDTVLPPLSFRSLGEHRLRDLARPEQVYQVCHPELQSEFPPLKSLDTLPNNLPVQLTSFVGREKELGIVKDLLSKTRLLTLTGSGGCGKTRLSLQIAADVLDQYADGVWLVELAPITNPDLVSQTVAQALGLAEQPGKTPMQTLTEYLKAKALLLVIDNCEHVLAACATLADILLRACPHVKVLASSREGLGIAGETVYRIPSLSLPDPKQTATPESLSQYEAVRLFLDRAEAALPSFTVTNANAPALASICHRLDGIPLGIELASARVRSLSVEEINSHLDNRFRLLTGGSKTALPRQQTLRALIDWSYDLLTAQEKSLLIRLSVFIGGWTLSAAEAVCVGDDIEDWEVLDLMTSLVDKSLVQTEETEGTTRYRFLETVRQYARDRLAEGDAGLVVRGQHRDYFMALAEEVRPKLRGVEQAQWLSILEVEHDNLRQALTFCLEDPDGGEKGLRLGGAMQEFWRTRGHFREGRERLTAALARPEAQAHTYARNNALNGAGVLARLQGDAAMARALHEESLAMMRGFGDRKECATSLNNLGLVYQRLSEYATARALYEESLTIMREATDRAGIAVALSNLGFLASEQGDYGAARPLQQESLAIWRELGDTVGIAGAVLNLGSVALEQGDYPEARALYAESLTIFREFGDKNGIANSLLGLAIVASEEGDLALTRSLYEESLSAFRALGGRHGIAACLSNLGVTAQQQGDYAASRALEEESLAIRREMGDQRGIAMSLINLGTVASLQGDCVTARSLDQEGLGLFRDMGNPWGIAGALDVFATLAVQEGFGAQAGRLWGAAEALRAANGLTLSGTDLELHTQQAAVLQEALGEEAFAAAWAEGRAMSMEQAVAEALGE